MYKFDTKVQHLKYKVLRTVAKHAWDGDFYTAFLDIPKEIIPGKTPSMRCCVYKERAILAERVKLAAGGDKNNPNVIEAIDIACDDCPTGGYTVTDVCRGCLLASAEVGALCQWHWRTLSRLLAEAGPQRALTVTFLLPLFAALWGFVFLGEALTATMIVGGLLIIVGTALALRA